MSVTTSFDDALIDDSLIDESFGSDLQTLISENNVLREDTDQVLSCLTDILISIDAILDSLNLKFGSYMDSSVSGDFDQLYSNLGSPEEYYTEASKSLTLQEYFSQVMGFSDSNLESISCTSMYIQLLNDLRNSIQGFSPGLISTNWGEDEWSGYTKYGSRSKTSLTTNSHLFVHGIEGTFASVTRELLKEVLPQSGVGVYDGLSRIAVNFGKSVVTPTGLPFHARHEEEHMVEAGESSIGVHEPSAASIQAPLNEAAYGGNDAEAVAAYFLYATRDLIVHAALQSSGPRNKISNYIGSGVTDTTNYSEIISLMFGDTGGEPGREILGAGLEPSTDQGNGSIYDDVVKQDWSSEMASSFSESSTNYLPFDRYSLIDSVGSYLPGVQIFINHMLTESETAGSTLLNPRRFVAFSEQLSKKVSAIKSIVTDLILARGASEYNSAKFFEICVKKIQNIFESRYSGLGDDINRSDLTRMFIFLLAAKDSAVDDALLNFLLVRSLYKRTGSGSNLRGEGKDNDSRIGENVNVAGDASVLDRSVGSSEINTAYENAAKLLTAAVRNHTAFGALESGIYIDSGEEVDTGTEIFDSVSSVKRDFDTADPFRSGGVVIEDNRDDASPDTFDSSDLQDDLEYDRLMRAVIYDHGEGEDLFDILWVCVSAFQGAIFNKYQTLSGFGSGSAGIETLDVLTYQSGGLNRYSREIVAYAFFKKFLSETISMTFSRGTFNGAREFSEGGIGMSEYEENDNINANYQFKAGIFDLVATAILENYKASSFYEYQDITLAVGNFVREGSSEIKDVYMTDGVEDSVVPSVLERALHLCSIYGTLVNEDAKIINILYYLSAISSEMKTAADRVETALAINEMSADQVFTEVINFLKVKGKNTLLTLSRDSLMTSKYLHKGYQNHRLYQYHTALKHFDSSQISNMVQSLTNTHSFLDSSTTYDFVPSELITRRRKIIIAGIPAGVIEYLRYKGAWLKYDSRYLRSTYLKISVHRRNLQDDTDIVAPKVFYFDTASYILEGLNDVEDAASRRSDTQSMTQLFSNTAKDLTMFDPTTIESIGSPNSGYENGLIRYTGTQLSITEAGQEVYQNHFFDYYLKMYLKVVLGIDVFEDSFPFNESETLSSTCDADKKEIFDSFMDRIIETLDFGNEPVEILKQEFAKTSSLISQSTPFSSVKNRNKAIFSRIFDRVFCLYVDIDDFEKIPSSFEISPELSHRAWSTEADGSRTFGDDPLGREADITDTASFYQIYTTYEIVPEIIL